MTSVITYMAKSKRFEAFFRRDFKVVLGSYDKLNGTLVLLCN